MTAEIQNTIFTILLSVIAFFLVRTMNKADRTYELATKNATDIALLKQREEMNKEHFDEKLDALQKSISEIKELIKKSTV